MGLGDRLRDFISNNIDEQLTDLRGKVKDLTKKMRQGNVETKEIDNVMKSLDSLEKTKETLSNLGTQVEGFLVDVGWGTYGFKAGPVSGETMAETIATGKTAELISSFNLGRFTTGELVGEKGAAAVGH